MFPKGIMKKKILLCLIAQLICWGIMTMSDYMEETYNDSFNLIVVFVVPPDVWGFVYYI